MAAIRKGPPAILKNYATAFVVPVVDHALENDRVGTRRHLLKEISSNELSSVTHTDAFEVLVCCRRTPRKVENRAANVLVLLRDSTDQFA